MQVIATAQLIIDVLEQTGEEGDECHSRWGRILCQGFSNDPIHFWEPILDVYAVCRLPSKRMDYKARITLEPGKRSGKPCIRGMRITVQDVLGYLAAGITQEQILEDFPYLEKEDILACLAYAADSEKYSLLVR